MTNDIKSEALQAEKVKLSEAQKTIVTQCWLAEFESLRNQILNYQQMQHNLIWINISAVGIILTATLTASIYWDWDWVIILLAMPFVSSLLGLSWVAQGIAISTAGHYVRQRVAPALQTLCLSPEVMGWEVHIRTNLKERVNKRRLFRILNPLLIPFGSGASIFVLSCLIGLGFTGTEVMMFNQWQIRALWGLAFILTLVLIVSIYWGSQHWIKSNV